MVGVENLRWQMVRKPEEVLFSYVKILDVNDQSGPIVGRQNSESRLLR
jgi:hypothetical protein